jgi:uroporphyrinogen-III synthase
VGETSRALAGKRVVITRSAEECQQLAAMIQRRGAVPVIFPLIEFAPPEDLASFDAALKGIFRFDWILFTSGQTVKAVSHRLAELTALKEGASPSDIRCAAVGPGTAEAAKLAGFRVHYVAQIHNGAALAHELGTRIKNSRLLLPRSDRANPDLPEALKLEGAIVTEVVAYRTVKPHNLDESVLASILSGEADALLFYSPSAVRHFSEVAGRSRFQVLQETMAITAVGPVTAAALRHTGIQRIEVAADTTSSAVIAALENHFSSPVNSAPAGAKRA